MVAAAPDVCELEQLSPAADEPWISELVGSCGIESDLNRDEAYAARAFGAPLRAEVHGVRCFVIIDGLERSLIIDGARDLPLHFSRAYSAGSSPFVLAGRRTFVRSFVNKGLGLRNPSRLAIEEQGFEDAGMLAKALCDNRAVSLTEQSRDLIVTLLERKPDLILNLAESASENGSEMNSFREVLKTYYLSLIGGRLGGFYESSISEAADGASTAGIFSLLDAGASGRQFSFETWLKQVGSREGIEYLAAEEIIEIRGDTVLTGSGSVLRDLAKVRNAGDGDPGRGRNIARLLSEGLKEAAGRMSALYRSINSIGMAQILDVFDCQEVPLALLDYGIYRETYKGADLSEMLPSMLVDLEKIKLPQVFHSESAAAFYPNLSELIEDDRAAIGFGFEHAEYDDENEVAWIAAEIDSKLEATEELTSFWCDRLEMAAIASDIEHFRIWLVAPEGFSTGALEVLHQRHAIGSSKAQVRMLENYLRSGSLVESETRGEAFEITIPMGEDTELIAAHAVEDIARKAGFDTKGINQIKTALVEACINAAEHSLSPDRKINLKIESRGNAFKITVSNRGLKFSGEGPERDAESEERRGWGLKLMRSLMDEVRFERVDDGTRIVMTKNTPDQPA